MTIGERISHLRKKALFSQEYVAERLGVSRQAVSKWETDASAPDTYNLIALAELFDVSVEYLATGKTSTPGQLQKEPAVKSHGTQRILGFILLGTGLLSLILGILLSEILIILSLYMLLGSIVCLAAQKNIWFIAMWSFLALTFFCFRGITGGLFCIFHPSFYQGGVRSIWMYVAVAFWLWLITAIAVTVLRIYKNRKNKN